MILTSDSIMEGFFILFVVISLSDLTQDIVVRQFDWNAFIKAYAVGVSV